MFLCLLFCPNDLPTEEYGGIEIACYQWICVNLCFIIK